MDKPKVLVVDDDVYVQSFIRNVLEGKGFTVIVSSGGDRALRLLEKHHFDVIKKRSGLTREWSAKVSIRLQ